MHPTSIGLLSSFTEEAITQLLRKSRFSNAPNGWIKQAMGFRRFSVRGLRKVQGEWALVCLVLNIKRMPGLQAA